MKFLVLPALLLSIAFASCAGGWQDEDKAVFLETCKTGDLRHFISDDQAASFCDCRLQKYMKHYPAFNDVILNKDSAAVEADMKECDAVTGL